MVYRVRLFMMIFTLLCWAYLLASGLLIYPSGGIFKLVVGLGIPIKIPNKTLGFAVNFQFQYAVPTNASELTEFFPQVVVRGRQQRHVVNRAATYRALQTALDRRGVSGRACLLRAVCEAAETPLHHNGLLGEILHLLLTPAYERVASNGLQEYLAAQRAGERGQDCKRMFPACPLGHGILDPISLIEWEEELLQGFRWT